VGKNIETVKNIGTNKRSLKLPGEEGKRWRVMCHIRAMETIRTVHTAGES
jgi:hypothetical protein